MSKPKVLPLAKWRAYNAHPKEKLIMWHGVAITVKTFLTLEEVTIFIQKVIDISYDAATHDCLSEIADFAIRTTVLSMYGNVEMPDNTDELYELVYRIDIYDAIVAVINQGQFNAILKAIRG